MSDWETVGKSNDGWEDVGGWETVSPPKRKTTLAENVGVSLNTAAQPFVKGAGLLAGGVATALGDTDTADSIYKKMEDTVQSMDDYWNPKDAEQSFGGKLQGMGMTLPAQMLGMLASPFDTGQSAVKAGESLDTARLATGIDTVGNMAGLLLPAGVGKTFGKQVISGGLGNAAQDLATRAAISGISETKKMKEMFEPTAESAAIAGIIGMGWGGKNFLDSAGAPQITTGKSSYKKPKVEETKYDLSVDKDLDNAITVRESAITAIEAQLARQPDKTNEFSQRLLADLKQKIDEVNSLYAARGKGPKIAVEATRIDDQLAVEYKAHEEELNRLQSEYKDLAKKGAALTAEEKLRLEEIQTRHAEVSDFLEQNAAKVLSEDPVVEPTRKLDQQSKSEFDFNEVAGEKLAWTLREPMLDALRRGGIREALSFLADPKHLPNLEAYGKALTKLAKALLDNPLIGRGKYIEDPNLPHAGGYDNISGYVHLKGDWTSSPVVFLHEVVHSAVNKALSLFDRGLLKDPQQVRAARAIKDLFNNIKQSPEKLKLLGRFINETDLKIYLENTREFVAYGISDHKFMLALDHIKLGPTKVTSVLTNAIKNMLGLKGEERTALDDVLRYSEILIQTSEGLPPGLDHNKATGLYSFNKIHTAQDIVAAIKSGSTKIFAHAFTQNLPQLMRHNKLFTAMEQQVAKAERAKEYLVRDINHGLDALKDWRKEGKFFYRTTGSEQTTALVPSMFNLKGVEIYSVYSTLLDGYRKGIDAKETIVANTGQWSKDQLTLANAIDNASHKLWEASVKMLANKNLDYTKLKQRIGYMLTSRVGDHTMQIRINGVLIKQQHFLTKGEADFWIKKVKEQNPNATIDYAHVKDIRENNATQSLKDFLDTASGLSGDELKKFINDTNEAFNESNSNIGTHTMRSNIVGGFIGDQFGMSARQMGEQLRTALPRMVENYAQNIMSRSVQKDYIDFLIDNEHKLDPTTNEVLNFYIQTQIGQPFKEGSWSDSARELSNKTREVIDVMVDSVFGYHNRDKHAIDRFMGLFSNVFYINNILMKPSIWLAQPLQALNSSRSAFKEGETPRQVLAALGETMMQLSVGKAAIKEGSQLESDIHYVATHYNTLHPQMTNEYNDMKVGSNPNSAINKTIDTLTGKKISAWGDRGSRYASFLFFYNLHKRSGLTGDALRNKAATDATNNMVAYGSKKLPAIYRELGIVGEQGATLATFAHTQLGNMIIDLKEFAQQRNARSTAPLIMTAAVTSILGGMVALPIIAEYELLRQMGIKLGWWGNQWPNVSELILDHSPRWASMGLLSDVTELDVDASMRYTTLFKKITDIQEQGLLAFAPHLAWGSDVVSNIIPAINPYSTVPERDQALKKVLPKGWVTGVVDQARNNWDLVSNDGPVFTRVGKKGQGGVERDLPAKIAPWVGTSTTKQAMDNRKILAGRERDKYIDSLVEKAVQYAVHGDKELASKTYKKLLVEAKGYDKTALDSKIEKQIAAMNTEGLYNRYITPGSGTITPEQESRIIRDNLGMYLKRRRGE